jgi:hypothetical protein
MVLGNWPGEPSEDPHGVDVASTVGWTSPFIEATSVTQPM